MRARLSYPKLRPHQLCKFLTPKYLHLYFDAWLNVDVALVSVFTVTGTLNLIHQIPHMTVYFGATVSTDKCP